LSNDEKELVMDNFINGSVKLLLATSVIEVGIDVSNAIIIIIENAERFGLAQLHQLRGRVGRGQKKSFCFLLLAQNADSQAHERIKEFCKLNDGFKIAEMDLKFRGPGEISGFKQSGWYELVFADIIRDADIFKEIQRDLDSILRA
jgi:ATP-dependent DNA helicase RecG